ncbi:hypothetical protein [Streptomyces sp. B6B3]|uniref:hypothetical protein n=1 Tax=Streptomyces sp. B6B3 TaxID=3153570 RepID=UPI00325F8258
MATTAMLLVGGAAVTAAAEAPGQDETLAAAVFTAPTSISQNMAWTSGNGSTLLRLQEDGHLVLYYQGQPTYSYAGTWSKGSVAAFQEDGNFVVYDANGAAVFNGDGACINSGQSPIWNQAETMRLTDDGRHQFLNARGQVLCEFPL